VTLIGSENTTAEGAEQREGRRSTEDVMDSNVKRNKAVVTAAIIGVAGLAMAGFTMLWVAGFLGISTAAASQIVAAILAGGWALRAVMIVFGAGIIGAILATVTWIVSVSGRGAAIV
jgi:uncharacterized membrane protein